MKGFFNPASWTAEPTEGDRLPRCGECGLSKTCTSPRMLATGLGRRKILFVAEAPGKEEDQKGVQLIGDAGQLLRKLLHEIGEDLEEARKTNAVICRPPKNVIKDTYVEACRPNLLRTLQEFKPTVVVLLGLSAVKGLIPTEWGRDVGALSRWVGWTIPCATHGAWLCPTYHPSYINRMNEDPVLVGLLKSHLQKAYSLERSGTVPTTSVQALQGEVEVVRHMSTARKRLRALARREGLLAFDYETTGLKPDDRRHEIVSCSFCLDGKETWACMIDETCHRHLSAVLRAPGLGKIASNLDFEERWTRAKLGHGVENWHWDTMLAAHALDNRPGITSVKFQAFVLLGVGDYEGEVASFLKSSASRGGFNRIREADPYQLLLYNGMDSLLEFMVMERQKAAAQERGVR